MSDAPELPEQFRSSGSVFDVLPDERPMRWTIWDLDGCIGEVSWSEGLWHSHPEMEGTADGARDSDHPRWQDAIDAVTAR
jgi:hypothetical protein